MEKTTPSKLIGSQTEKNLMRAFIGESEARNKYTFFASVASNEGYEQIGAIFNETANNEKEHAEIWLNALGGIKSTQDNLIDAINGEDYEFSEMYKEFSEIAKQEGFLDIANKFKLVAEIEKQHRDRYKKLLENVEDGLVFSRDGDKIWKCRNCGHIVIGKQAPEICPVCSHPKAYFEIKAENY